MSSRHSWIALSLVPGVGVTAFWRLVAHFSTPQAVLQASPQELMQVSGLRESSLHGLGNQGPLAQRVEAELTGIARLGGEVLVWGDENYPEALARLTDPPPVLYTIGDSSLLHGPALAVVGSRAASSYGLRVAAQLSAQLAAAGVVIVSGLAAGIDAAAHRGALTAGKTVAVLGCGLDKVYPKQNARLYEEIAAHGVLVSEYPLGTRPDGFRFPARNRIIAGLVSGVVVVEAARKSGSLITAQIALDYGRDVFAVPGQMDSCKSEGCHLLIKTGANLVLGVEDILKEIGLQQAESSAIPGSRTAAVTEPETERVFRSIDVYPVAKDELVDATGLEAGRINELCLMLELEGLVENLPGNRVRRIA